MTLRAICLSAVAAAMLMATVPNDGQAAVQAGGLTCRSTGSVAGMPLSCHCTPRDVAARLPRTFPDRALLPLCGHAGGLSPARRDSSSALAAAARRGGIHAQRHGAAARCGLARSAPSPFLETAGGSGMVAEAARSGVRTFSVRPADEIRLARVSERLADGL